MALVAAGRITALTHRIIGCGIRVHRYFGPGLLHAPYAFALAYELTSIGLRCEREIACPVVYGGTTLPCAYRLDMVVEDTVVVEIKAIDRFHDIHRAQLITYLKLSGYPAGLLINFNVPVLKDGIMRVLNDARVRRVSETEQGS